MLYDIRFVHRVSPSDRDVRRDVELPAYAFTDRRALAKCLRAKGIMQSGERLRSFRSEGSRVVAFPDRGIWHCIVIDAR